MVFSSLVFIFLFLPSVLFFYYISPKACRNFILLFFSLAFYAWGEPIFVLVMLLSIFFNYLMGLLIHFYGHHLFLKKAILVLTLIFNLGVLIYFKYKNFFVENLNQLLHLDVAMAQIVLPLGISFFTFQAMSYVIDVYRSDASVQKNPINLALYISLFPQLIAGPIVRYTTIEHQLNHRIETVDLFLDGLKRFLIGLCKKILIANNIGFIANEIFNMPLEWMSVGTSWVGILCYSAQIYFDFSGYSDMAIGLGKMFGFEFLENFNYPYISKSISEFWRRWHISLGSWFRDYVYIPLGGSKKSAIRTYFNLAAVWFLTGLWHGASWNFIAWGSLFGCLIMFEKAGFESWAKKIWWPIRTLSTIIIVVISWVFFRSPDIHYALSYIQIMFGRAIKPYDLITLQFIVEYKYLMMIALLFSTPVFKKIEHYYDYKMKNNYIRGVIPLIFGLFLFAITLSYLVTTTFNPFIYFRF